MIWQNTKYNFARKPSLLRTSGATNLWHRYLLYLEDCVRNRIIAIDFDEWKKTQPTNDNGPEAA